MHARPVRNRWRKSAGVSTRRPLKKGGARGLRLKKGAHANRPTLEDGGGAKRGCSKKGGGKKAAAEKAVRKKGGGGGRGATRGGLLEGAKKLSAKCS